jgi:hypothetical protein
VSLNAQHKSADHIVLKAGIVSGSVLDLPATAVICHLHISLADGQGAVLLASEPVAQSITSAKHTFHDLRKCRGRGIASEGH